MEDFHVIWKNFEKIAKILKKVYNFAILIIFLK